MPTSFIQWLFGKGDDSNVAYFNPARKAAYQINIRKRKQLNNAIKQGSKNSRWRVTGKAFNTQPIIK